jgi:type I restriction enzyme R subunit
VIAHAFTEDQLVEQPAIALFGELGWQALSAMEETFGPDGTLGRETKGEVVLVGRLKSALEGLNPEAPAEAVQHAIDQLTRDRSAMSLEAANRDIYQLMKDGVPVSLPNREQGGQKLERLRVVDWEDPNRNSFLLVSQLSVVGDLYTCRPDLVGFVNGLPWVVVELKKPGVSARAAFDENLTHYKKEVPQLFWYNALLIASNGIESRVGSITADWERFSEWKRIESEDEPRRVALEVVIRGTCDKGRLLDLVENFTLFSEHKLGTVKILSQNHQFLGVNSAIASMKKARIEKHGRAGVFWQTQGSGKSLAMVFFAQKIMRKIAGNWTFVVVTDRVELDDQIAKTFKAVGAVGTADADDSHASSGAHLRTLLRGNSRYVFTLIQKFQTSEALTERSDVVVITDEAHRSQYDTLALNMRAAMPNAMFLAFTGTPLIAGEERTREVFGDYVSVYDFQQSVEDGATVPLFYENRTPELRLENPSLNDDIYAVIEAADLDDAQEEKLEKLLGRQYHLITRDDRLEEVARDIVHHFLGRGFVGKAMVVSIDKATALRMHEKVQTHWKKEIARLEKLLASGDTTSDPTSELERRLELLRSTDMAVVVSPGQNEIEQMRKLGLEIEPHRRRMATSQPGLDEKFKDPADSLRIVFVCAMWLTGFDAPSCSTIYLDKPMRNHTLMQTIARANRVFPGKYNGLIVDYANVFTSLEKALAIYAAGKGGSTPLRDKSQLLKQLQEALRVTESFCSKHGVDLAGIEAAPTIGIKRLQLISNATDALISPDPVRLEFSEHEHLLTTLYGAVQPSLEALASKARVQAVQAIADAINAKLAPQKPDVTDVLAEIAKVLDASILGIELGKRESTIVDLSKIDFEKLTTRFSGAAHKRTELEALKAAVRSTLQVMVQLNRTRVDFADQFQALIQRYNEGSATIDAIYKELLELSKSLSEEQQRHVRENLSEEELVILDILTRPAPELSQDERAQVKKAAKILLERLKETLVLDWRQKEQARSQLRLVIEKILDDELPPAYSKELYAAKCSALFEHVYESYRERNQSIYAGAA